MEFWLCSTVRKRQVISDLFNYKYRIMRSYVIMIGLILFVGCCRNQSPVCSIVVPLPDASYESGEEILISVDASDPDGLVSEVRIYVNGIGKVSLANFPFNYLLETDGFETGDYNIKAMAVDNEGKEGNDEVNITLTDASTVTDFDGNVYKTIVIGEQVWMAENLKVTHFADGTPMQLVEDSLTWLELNEDTKAYCFYDFLDQNGDIYGPIYTFPAAINGTWGTEENPSSIQGVCPSGWHLPSDAEWSELEINLGMSESETVLQGWRGTNEGSKMKEVGTAHWDEPNDDATNESGFTALPGGHINTEFMFILMGRRGSWWTASGSGNGGVSRHVDAVDTRINKSGNPPTFAFSVRCVKDR